jgi:long-chain fatty acid transport protein
MRLAPQSFPGRASAALLCLVCALGAGRAHASPLFELLGGIGGQAGLNGRVAGPSAASTYFNPALLPDAAPGFQTGLLVLSDSIHVTLDGRSGVDVPISYRGATRANGSVFAQPALPTQWLKLGCPTPECTPALAARPRQAAGSSDGVHEYGALGLVVPVAKNHLVLGIYALVPIPIFTSAHSFFVDEREQFFTNSLHPELYSDRLTATSLAVGLGSRLTKRLSLGLDVTLDLRNSASAQTFVGNADDLSRTLVLSDNVGVAAKLAPHLGIVYDPIDRLRLSATVHSVQSFDINSSVSTFLPDGNRQTAERRAVHDYMPWQFGLGASVDVLEADPTSKAPTHQLSVVATAVLGLWSTYRDRQDERPLPGYAWSNTLSVGVGARHGYGRLHSYLDLLYVPTPVPLQTGRTNYVDNNRLSSAAGVEYEMTLFGVAFRLGAQAQVHALPSRYQQKLDPTGVRSASERAQLVRDEFPDGAIDSRGDPIAAAAGLQTNNPGWPGFASSGILAGGALTLALLY